MSHLSGTAEQPWYIGAPTRRGRHAKPAVDLLAPSVWSDRARLLARPDVMAAEVLLLIAVGVLVREPVLELVTPALAATEAPAPTPLPLRGPVLPLEVAPGALPTITRNAPRDPFAPLVPAAAPAEGAAPSVDAATAILPAPPESSVTVPDPSAPLPAPAAAAVPAPVPAPVPAAPAPEAPAPEVRTVTVQSGDTLQKIATQHGTTARELYEANRSVIGANPNLLYPGTQLRLP